MPSAAAPPPITHRLTGRRLAWARAAWLGLAALVLIPTGLSWPAYSRLARQVCADCPITPDYAATLAQAGLTPDLWAAWQVGASVLVTLGWAGMGLLIFARRSNDRRALVISALLILVTPGIGGLPFNTNTTYLLWSPIARLANLLFSFGFVALLLTLPNGRIAPRWTGGLLLYLTLVAAPNALAPNSPWAFGNWELGLRTLAFILPMFATAVSVPLYRYLRVFTLVERQQAKWAVLGIMVFVAGAFTTAVVSASACVDGPTTGAVSGEVRLYCAAVQSVGYSLSPLMIPVFIGVAILRSRLWDIDVIIRRTVIYSVLSAVLALVYFGTVVVLEGLLRGVVGGDSPIAIVLSTLVIAALFVPLRGRVQRVIDRRFYRKKYDAARTLAAFGAQARDVVALEQLTSQLVRVVDETMQPAHVGLWVRGPARPGGQP